MKRRELDRAAMRGENSALNREENSTKNEKSAGVWNWGLGIRDWGLVVRGQVGGKGAGSADKKSFTQRRKGEKGLEARG